jgi:hypothetical protein
LHENARLRALSESELRHAAVAPTSRVFNWRADGWGPGRFMSDSHDCGRGVTGECLLTCSLSPDYSHFIGFELDGIDSCKVHASFSLLDRHDRILRRVHEFGTAAVPDEIKCSGRNSYSGRNFTPTAREQEQAVRADGSIRLRAVVRLFLEDGGAE